VRAGGFRFAVVLSLALALVTAAVAATYHLPVRDPDGVAVPTYVRLPVILLLAFLTDVVPRAAWRGRSPRRMPRALAAVIRERWPWEHVRFALVGLGAWYLTYAAFRNLKSFVPFVNRRRWDGTLERFDRVTWLGHDPATVLHHLFGTGWAAQFFSLVYVVWIVLVPVSLVVALVWSRDRAGGAWYVTAVAVDWVLGVATYFAVPTLGPVYADPQQFATLPHTYVSTLQESMIADRYTVLADPFATHTVQTIAAFASLHVGIMVTVCLIVELLGMKRWLRILMWVYLVLTVLATVYLGWHYFADTLGGAVLGATGVWVAALGTGNHVRGRPRRMARDAVAVPRTVPEPAGAQRR
jgi:PAP2 superfamily